MTYTIIFTYKFFKGISVFAKRGAAYVARFVSLENSHLSEEMTPGQFSGKLCNDEMRKIGEIVPIKMKAPGT